MNKLSCILILSVLTISIYSCRKKSTTPDNPDVSSSIIDSVSVAPAGNGKREAAIDADKDGVTDFFLSTTNDDGAYSTDLDALQVLNNTNFTTDGSGFLAEIGENAIIDSVSVPKGPRPPRAIWSNFANCSFADGLNLEGYAGIGDFFAGFYLEKPDGKHYGWLKLNIPAEGKSIKLLSLGYHTKPRTAIKAGER